MNWNLVKNNPPPVDGIFRLCGWYNADKFVPVICRQLDRGHWITQFGAGQAAPDYWTDIEVPTIWNTEVKR